MLRAAAADDLREAMEVHHIVVEAETGALLCYGLLGQRLDAVSWAVVRAESCQMTFLFCT